MDKMNEIEYKILQQIKGLLILIIILLIIGLGVMVILLIPQYMYFGIRIKLLDVFGGWYEWKRKESKIIGLYRSF